MQFILATTNLAKLRALGERVGPGISLESLPETAQHLNVPDEIERGGSFAEIAMAKATWYSRHISDAVIVATDGGLVAPALQSSWNPLQTARAAGPNASNAERRETLLKAARNLTGTDRSIHWVESLAVSKSGEVLATWTATGPPGELAHAPTSHECHAGGFWVPTVWQCPELGGRLLVDLTDEERLSRRDHWAILGDHLTGWAAQWP